MTSGGSLHLPDLLQHFQAVDSGQPDIEQDQVEAAFAEQFDAVFTARADADFVALVFEDAAQGLPDAGFVIDDEDVCHGLGQL